MASRALFNSERTRKVSRVSFLISREFYHPSESLYRKETPLTNDSFNVIITDDIRMTYTGEAPDEIFCFSIERQTCSKGLGQAPTASNARPSEPFGKVRPLGRGWRYPV